MVLDRPVFGDASPLIGLARIGRLDLLRLLPIPVRVTTEVWREVTGDSSQPGVQAVLGAEQTGLLTVVEEGDPSEFPFLGAGEASTLSAALSAGGAVLIDETKARRLLEHDPRLAPVPYLTTVALVVLAKRRGHLDRVRPILDALRSETFRISEGLYEDALRTAGEWPEGGR